MTNNVAKLQTPFDTAMARMCADISTAQLRQHLDLYRETLATITTYIDGPRGAGLHRDALGFWRHQVRNFGRLERSFSQALASRSSSQVAPAPTVPTSEPNLAEIAACFAADGSLRRVRKILESSDATGWFRLRADLTALLRGVCQIQLAPEIQALRLRELHYVVFAIEHPEFIRKGATP